ncbi:MAG: glycoside hydrolase family 2 TIM barrel-domain containing protein [Bacteroidota bacterium]
MRTFTLNALILILISNSAFGQSRFTKELSEGWKFQKGHHENAFQIEYNDNDWEDVTVPHDWAISGPFVKDGDGNTGKLPWKGEGWYRKNIDVSSELEGKHFYLLFDGVMAFPKVYLNGTLAGEWDYGYNSFYLDVTDLLKTGEDNMLVVHADTRPHDSRWYPGAGIYRKVQLLAVDPVHTEIWGTYITTPIIKPHFADVRIAAMVNNFSNIDSEISVAHAIYDSKGREVGKSSQKGRIAQGKQHRFESTITVSEPRLWDINDPHLYSAVTTITREEEVVDTYTTRFGIRSIRFTANDGFYLNNRRVQLKGVNLHHDLGPLGGAFNKRAMERQLEIMKEMGCNAIRNSHNTAAPELLELCDEMGLLMFNEVFDKYDGKAGITEDTDFESFTHRNIKNFVLRDRNNPSNFLWSVGNEIGDVQWNIDNGFHKLHLMLNFLERYDPTRPNTLVCDNKASARMRHFDYYDVHAWNYGRRYELARQMEPNKSVIISESASTLSTRGFYEFPLPEKKTDFTKSLQVSSYDLNAPWWAEVADDDFMWQQQEPYIAGEFVWTGFDYLGEPTPYNNAWTNENGMTDLEASRSSYFGIVDLCGIPKDRYYLYKSYWKPEETTVHILPHWNWEDRIGKNVPVFVYTNGDCAELFLNGKSLGTQCKDPKSENSTERFRLMWKEVTYSPGELKAVAYKDGQVIGEQFVRTAGEPVKLKVTPDRKTINADGKDLSFVLVEAYDKVGNLAPLADNLVKINIDGKATIAGVGNGNPQSFKPFQSDEVNLFYGKAMLILQAGKKAGDIVVSFSAEGLEEAQAIIRLEE